MSEDSNEVRDRIRQNARELIANFPSEMFTDDGREYFTASVSEAVAIVAGLLASHEQLRAQLVETKRTLEAFRNHMGYDND